MTDEVSLRQAVAGQDAVINSLGSPLSRKPTTLLSDGTRKLVQAMKEAQVRRLVCITGIGAGDSKGHGGFLYDWILQPLLLSEVYKDKDRQEDVVRASGLDWTLVRPGTLTNGGKTGKVKAYTSLTGVTIGQISRADVAEFILGKVVDVGSIGQTFTLST